jgi:arsenate reductase (thioredoxin)
MIKQKVLFLCTGNSCRSQMAEAWLKKLGVGRFDVFSAGIDPKPIHPFTLRVMGEVGLDMKGHYSKLLSDPKIPDSLDYLITVCAEAEKNCPVGLVKARTRSHWYFDDPASVVGSEAERLAKFREVRDLIKGRITTWINDLPSE